VGAAVVTGAGDLPARWVIHAVGPIWHGGAEAEEMLLASAVRAALKRAEEVGARSVALPAISAGVYGFPLRRAAALSIGVARSFAAEAQSLERIIFCLYDDASLAAFERAFAEG
jgi:O-acetyl-ADP-ribose deacetylase (regulator of RNase III)